MHIAFDARVIQDHFPGIGRYAFNLLAALSNELHNDETLTILHDPSVANTRLPLARLQDKLKSPDMHWQEWLVPMFGTRVLLSRLPHTVRTVAHFPYYLRPIWPGCPSITTIFDTLFFVYPQVAPSARARIANRMLNGLSVLTSQRVITASHSAAQEMMRFLPASKHKTVVIPIAADPVFAPRDRRVQTDVIERLKLPPHFSLYLASNKPHKNLVRLVEAWGAVTSNGLLRESTHTVTRYPAPALVIAGHQDPRYSDAQQRAKALGIEDHVRFIGAVTDDDAAALYSACDLFVFPSLYEGFGLTPLEAMACGAPVACSNTTSLPEVAGDAALLFDPTQPDSIAAICLKILRDEHLRMHLRERSLAQASHFTWRDAARHTISVYRDVARGL